MSIKFLEIMKNQPCLALHVGFAYPLQVIFNFFPYFYTILWFIKVSIIRLMLISSNIEILCAPFYLSSAENE